MKIEEYRKHSIEQLEEMVVERKTELGGLAFQEESDPSRKEKLRKDIARIKTILQEKRNVQAK